MHCSCLESLRARYCGVQSHNTVSRRDALAGAALSLMNYLLLGWAVDVDGFYLHSFEIWLACMVVFPAAGNLGFTLLEYRLGHRNLLDSLIENLTWVPFLCVSPRSSS